MMDLGEETKEDQDNVDKKDGEQTTSAEGKFESCDEEQGPFYDKSVSFYDGISCDKSDG